MHRSGPPEDSGTTPETVATAITDGQGRFLCSREPGIIPPRRRRSRAAASGLLARASDGRVGWLTAVSNKDAAGKENAFEIAVGPVA